MTDQAILDMAHDALELSGYRRRTIETYVTRVRLFLEFCSCPLGEVTMDDVRRYLLHLLNVRHCSGSTVNQALWAIKFLYTQVLRTEWDSTGIRFHRRPRSLPIVLSRSEVKAILEASKNLEHRTMIMTAYATGLRVSELTHLQVRDIDSDSMQIRVRDGKGGKDRCVLLSPCLLKALRIYWKQYRPKTWLFPGRDPDRPICQSTIRNALAKAAMTAHVTKHVTVHTLRHTFAVHLLEQGTHLRYIQELLGHADIRTTMIYLKILPWNIEKVRSPLEFLGLEQP